jgi:hypothetical protein
VVDSEGNKYIIDVSMYAGQSSFNESSVPLFENDKYILKTQVVPPVCPTCPGLGSAPYAAAAAERQEIRQGVRQEVRQGVRQEVRQGVRQEAIREARHEAIQNVASNVATGSDSIQNNNVAPHLNAQREFNQSNNDYDFGPNSLTNNNNLDNYEPQSVLNDFSKF